MMDLRILIFAVVIGVLSLGVIFAVRALFDRQRAGRLRRLAPSEDEPDALRENSSLTQADGLASRMEQRLERLVQRSGLSTTADQLLAWMCLLGSALPAGLYLWRAQLGLSLGGFLVGLLAPVLVFWVLRGRHQAKLQKQLPDALYLMARALRTGKSLEQVIELLADKASQPLAGEFRRCAAALQLNLPVATALGHMSERIQLFDFSAFVSTVSFHQKTGGNLPLLLDRLAASARDRNQYRGQFRAATTQGRLTTVALAVAAPLMLVGYALVQPDYSRSFFTDGRGLATLAVVLVLELIGIVWVYKLLKTDY